MMKYHRSRSAVTRRTFLRGAALSLGLIGTSCGWRASSHRRPNVVLLVIDALRHDRVEAERDGIPVMPALKGLRDESLWFANATAACSWTKPSMVSMFTSLAVPAHGVEYSSVVKNVPVAQRFIPETLKLLPECLRDAGYYTMGVQTNPHLTGEMGFAQGINDYPYLPLAAADRVTQEAHALLEKHAGEMPFFLYLHYIDPHEPYWPPERYKRLFNAESGVEPARLPRLEPGAFKKYFDDARMVGAGWKQEREIEPFSREEKEVVRAYYDGEARFADDQVSRVLESIARDFPNTLIVVTADHGEELWDHGSTGHGHTLYNELLHVPLLMMGPGIQPRVVEQPAQAIDLVPTIAGYVGIAPSDAWQGRDLLQGDGSGPAYVFSRTRASLPVEMVDLHAVQHDCWKLVADQHTGEALLFNLAEDPGETRNMQVENPDIVAAMRNALAAHLAQCGSLRERLKIPEHEGEPAELSDETMQQLRDLGYVR